MSHAQLNQLSGRDELLELQRHCRTTRPRKLEPETWTHRHRADIPCGGGGQFPSSHPPSRRPPRRGRGVPVRSTATKHGECELAATTSSRPPAEPPVTLASIAAPEDSSVRAHANNAAALNAARETFISRRCVLALSSTLELSTHTRPFDFAVHTHGPRLPPCRGPIPALVLAHLFAALRPLHDTEIIVQAQMEAFEAGCDASTGMLGRYGGCFIVRSALDSKDKGTARILVGELATFRRHSTYHRARVRPPRDVPWMGCALRIAAGIGCAAVGRDRIRVSFRRDWRVGIDPSSTLRVHRGQRHSHRWVASHRARRRRRLQLGNVLTLLRSVAPGVRAELVGGLGAESDEFQRARGHEKDLFQLQSRRRVVWLRDRHNARKKARWRVDAHLQPLPSIQSSQFGRRISPFDSGPGHALRIIARQIFFPFFCCDRSDPRRRRWDVDSMADLEGQDESKGNTISPTPWRSVP
ncbi:hypothetical protein B0H14DRAFT_2590726 [Mycena olivaceomarginata]|nr:hypothetical protein B0H14DRAFT_2590726 [Mycena olivaceomarginata]